MFGIVKRMFMGLLISIVNASNHRKCMLLCNQKFTINSTQPRKTFILSLHYNGSNSFLFVNATKIYHVKAKEFEIKDYALCLGNISKDFKIDIMKRTGLKRSVKFFSVDFNSIDTNNILDIHRYLMK